jgi:small redox-active disulfide protein 1
MAIEVVNEVEKDMPGTLTVEKIDIMQDREKAIEYGLMAVPAIALNGVVRFVGAPSKEELVKAIEEETNQ